MCFNLIRKILFGIGLLTFIQSQDAKASNHTSLQSRTIADTGSHDGHNKKNLATGLPNNLPDTFKEYILNAGESVAKKISDNLFIKAQAEKKGCYIGEPVVVTYKLYSRLPATSIITKQPRLGGFSAYDMTDFVSLSESIETVNNRAFKVHVLKKSQLLPLQAGDLVLDPMELSNTIHFVKIKSDNASEGKNLKDLFDHLTLEESSPSFNQHVKIHSGPVIIKVNPFPDANRPANFNSAIGSFTIRASVAHENIEAKGDDVLKVEILGKGNLPLIEAPGIDWPSGIDVLDIHPAENFDKSIAPLQGSKVFEFRFSPGKAGEFIIPPVSFSYFDPVSKSYKTIHSKSNSLRVSQGKIANVENKQQGAHNSSSKNGSFLIAVETFIQQQVRWVIVTSLLVLCCVLLLYRNLILKPKEKSVTVVPVTQYENKETAINMNIISECADILSKKDFKRFYDCLSQGMWKLLARKLGLNPSELNKTTITTVLQKKGWSPEMTDRLNDILTKTERSKYLPDYIQDTDASIVLKQAEVVTKQLFDL